DRSDGAVLLLDRDSDSPGNGGDFLDDAVDLFDRVGGVGDRRLDGTDLAGNFLGGFGGLAGERLDLGGHHRKALAGFAGARPLNSGLVRNKRVVAGDRLMEPPHFSTEGRRLPQYLRHAPGGPCFLVGAGGGAGRAVVRSSNFSAEGGGYFLDPPRRRDVAGG